MNRKEFIKSAIWREVAEPDNPFAAASCFCHGYDVFGDVIGKASWIEYLFLLFTGDKPAPAEANLLEDLAVILANPGPRDHSVMAAMNGGAGGSGSAACLMAALGVGAGLMGGSREVAIAMQLWTTCGNDLEAWQDRIKNPQMEERADVWPVIEHPPGFDPHGATCTTPVKQALKHLSAISRGRPALPWLDANRPELERISQYPLSMTGVAAAAFHDLGMSPDQGEMLHLILRLPGAAAHALEQKQLGYRNFPFFRHSVHLINDPAASTNQEADPANP